VCCETTDSHCGIWDIAVWRHAPCQFIIFKCGELWCRKFPYFRSLGDFNGDSKPDIVVTNAGSGNVSVLINNGNATFQSAVNYTVVPAPSPLLLVISMVTASWILP
jgi:hypothetical protein